MNIDTNTKYIESYFKGAPILENIYGSLNNLLKHTLTFKYNTTPVTSLNKDKDTLMINLPINHGFNKNQVVILESDDSPRINKEYRVLSVNTTSVLVKDFSETLITNTSLTLSGSPLGYTIPYENEEEGVICFKNKSLKSPAILRSIDKIPPNGYSEDWSKYARVTIGQHLGTDGKFKNNIKAPYHPDYPYAEETGDDVIGASGIHGFAKWVYSKRESYSGDESSKPATYNSYKWILIGDSISFYLMIQTAGDPNSKDYGLDIVGYGNFKSDNPKETSNVCLQAKDGFMKANAGYSNPTRTRNNFGALDSDYSGFILTDVYGSSLTNFNRCRNLSKYLGSSNPKLTHNDPYTKSHDPLTNSYIISQLFIKDSQNYMRGHHRGIYVFYGDSWPPNKYVDGNHRVTIYVQNAVESTSYFLMPLLFDLKNWESDL